MAETWPAHHRPVLRAAEMSPLHPVPSHLCQLSPFPGHSASRRRWGQPAGPPASQGPAPSSCGWWWIVSSVASSQIKKSTF